MKSIRLNRFLSKLATACLAAGCLATAPSAIAASTWNVDQCSVSTLQSAGTGCGVAGNSVHAYAYDVSNTAGSTFQSATLAQAGTSYGLMVTGHDTHALDNSAYTELVAFRFDSSVILDKITLGWTSTDADFSLFAWTGSGSPSSDGSNKIVGNTVSALAATASGWSLVGNYANQASSNDVVATVNAGNVSSSWWIVSAYNSGYGTGANLSGGNDYMKIMTIASKDPQRDNGKVSEPAALLLMGTALFGIVGLRRRRQGDQ